MIVMRACNERNVRVFGCVCNALLRCSGAVHASFCVVSFCVLLWRWIVDVVSHTVRPCVAV